MIKIRFGKIVMMTSSFVIRTLFLGVLSAGLVEAHAQLIVSNLDSSNGGSDAVGSDNWFAQGFSTPASTSYFFTSVQLKLAREELTLGTFDVSLWNSSGGKPAAQVLLVSSGVDAGSLSTSMSVYTFNAPSQVTLSANSTYFVVMSASASVGESGVNWGWTSQPTSPGGPGQIGAWTRSNNQGVTWDPLDPESPFQIAVYGTPVPEPQAYAAVAGLALLAFAACRRLQTRPANQEHS